MSRLPLQALQGFVTAARLGKLSLAAEALNLTVSALSHQVRGLEDRLQQRLCLLQQPLQQRPPSTQLSSIPSCGACSTSMCMETLVAVNF